MTGKQNELRIEASVDKLPEVLDFVESHLSAADCPFKTLMQINIAVEEVFVNIASYAYAPNTGDAVIQGEISSDPAAVRLTFIDRGIPYNPLEKKDPDVTLSAEERQIGGLGIFMTKKLMDKVDYAYRDGQNILTLTKLL